ncbi:MAG: T9SS type A sorting domain-containing protein, partial [Ignavibacterium sp.]
FNPTTKIRFVIPASSLNPFSKGEGTLVRLKVYDVLGNEVATLVNEEKPAGSYEVDFDGSSLSSGIYFYKLSAGSFTSVRKMLLIR